MKELLEGEKGASPSVTKRLSKDEVKRQSEMLQSRDWSLECFECVSDVILILNEHEQIVYVNANGLRMFEKEHADEVLGYRFGEVMGCVSATDCLGGCGCSPFCTDCGSFKAFQSGLRGEHAVEECHLLLRKDHDAHEVLVTTNPVVRNNETFTIAAITDLSDQKRRKVLERVFFHDLLKSAEGIQSVLDILRDLYGDEETYFSMLHHTSDQLIDEIQKYRLLTEAEQGGLTISPVACDTDELLVSLRNQYQFHSLAKGRTVQVVLGNPFIDLRTDISLLNHVLKQLLINALEASDSGDTVSLSATMKDSEMSFHIHNPGVMAPDVQDQLFHRSFSTKGEGRGSGAYSVLLLTETYLDGKVTFCSSEKEGTTFTVTLPV